MWLERRSQFPLEQYITFHSIVFQIMMGKPYAIVLDVGGYQIKIVILHSLILYDTQCIWVESTIPEWFLKELFEFIV